MTLVDFRNGIIAYPETVEMAMTIEPDVADLGAIGAQLPTGGVVAVRFPVFSDGRAYSIARRLRHEFGYAGRLWAVGDVLVDQVPLMARVGFDGFAFAAAPDRELVARALGRYRAVYQAGADGRNPIWELRRTRRAA